MTPLSTEQLKQLLLLPEHCDLWIGVSREEWLQKRLELNRQGVFGSSQMGVICGHNKFHSRSDLFLEITGRKEPENLDGNLNVEMGQYMEGFIAEKFRETKPVSNDLIDPGDFTIVTSSKSPHLFATIDRAWVGASAIVELKFVSGRKAYENGGMPEMFRDQLAAQLAVTQYPMAYLAALCHTYPPELFIRQMIGTWQERERIEEAASAFASLLERDQVPID